MFTIYFYDSNWYCQDEAVAECKTRREAEHQAMEEARRKGYKHFEIY